MRGSDPLASPAAGEATSPGNWMLTMPSASSSVPFSPVQPVHEMKSRAQQHQMHGKHASDLKHRVSKAYGVASSVLQRFAFRHRTAMARHNEGYWYTVSCLIGYDQGRLIQTTEQQQDWASTALHMHKLKLRCYDLLKRVHLHPQHQHRAWNHYADCTVLRVHE